MKIITTVGTSLLLNAGLSAGELDKIPFNIDLFYVEQDNITFKHLKNKLISLEKYLDVNGMKSCAETSSIDKIDSECIGSIYLLCTETTASYLCGKALEYYFKERVHLRFVKGLQVQNQEIFRKLGVPNLLTSIEQVAQNGSYWDDVVLNITGGYKAIIPIMSIIGQIRKLPTYYIFGGEEEKKYELIELPRMPIGYQTNLFELYLEQFEKFGEKGENILMGEELHYNFKENCSGFLEISDGYHSLNPIGKILWWNYQQDHFYFYSTDEIYNDIKEQRDILSVLKRKMNSNLLASKTERKGDHDVFDDGNNNNRIYYFFDSGKIYIYKTFQNEEKAQKYIKEPFKENHRKNFKSSSKRFKILI